MTLPPLTPCTPASDADDPVYRLDKPPCAGDLLIMLLPPEFPAPPGWTELKPGLVKRVSDGTEDCFPGPTEVYVIDA